MMYPQAISHGNILSFTPPGFNQELNVKFPDSRLAVCEKCKKNYKTRDMCRVRNNHTAPPWTTAYICITLDESCTDDNGKYIDKPLTVRMVQWQPFCVKKPFDPQHPVCSSCKKTNRTRSFCRERHKHRQLPWCTVYVMLSALDSTDPNTVVAEPSKPLEGTEEEENSKSENDDDARERMQEEEKAALKEAAKLAATANESVEKDGEEVGTIDNDFAETDDICEIPESRTFLARVSYKGIAINWLDLGEYDPSDAAVAMGFIAPEAMRQSTAATMEPPPAPYYTQGMQQQQQQLNRPPHQQPYYYQVPRQQPYAGQQQWAAQYPPQQPVAAGTVPVTAGEAAAQQQKQSHGVVEGDPNAPQGQWQMVYPGQMYGYSSHSHGEKPEHVPDEVEGMNGLEGDMEPAFVDGEQPNAKRYRSV